MVKIHRTLLKSPVKPHLVTPEIVCQAIPKPDPDVHKGLRGRLLLIAGGSSYFHGAGQLAAIAAREAMITMVTLAGYINDMVMFCSTPANVRDLRTRILDFIGVPRSQFTNNLKKYDAILIGPGMMRATDEVINYAKNEPKITRKMTLQALNTDKKLVLDAGSLQVIKAEELKGKKKVIITPHRGEMARLFGYLPQDFFISQSADFQRVIKVARLVQGIASEYGITILLKGPIDVIANKTGWFFSPGGDPGMATGGSGDVLAGLTAAIYCRTDNPILAASAASYILKKTGEYAAQQHHSLDFYTASELTNNIRAVMEQILT